MAVPIKSPQILSQLRKLSDQIDYALAQNRISKSLVSFVEIVANAHDLDIIITINSYSGKSPWKIGNSPIFIQGYGLLTRNTLLSVVGFRRN